MIIDQVFAKQVVSSGFSLKAFTRKNVNGILVFESNEFVSYKLKQAGNSLAAAILIALFLFIVSCSFD